MARLTSFTIDGVEIAADHLKDLSLTIEHTINGRSTAECTSLDRASTYRAEPRDVILVEMDNEPVFGGILWDQDEDDIAGPVGTGIIDPMVFVDFWALSDVVYFNGIIEAGTLREQLEPLIANMVPHGLSLSDDQEDGPTLPAQGFDFLTIRQAVEQLSLQSGWVGRVDTSGTFRMYEPGTLPAPFDITEALGNYRRLTWNRNLNAYRNEAWARYGPQGVVLFTEEFEGDGVTTLFNLSHPLIMAGTGVTPAGYVTVTRAATTSLEPIGADETGFWDYDPDVDTLEQLSGAVLLAGETVSITYNAQFPGFEFYRDEDEYATYGPFTMVFDYPDVLDPVQALALITGEVRRRVGLVKRVELVVDQPGIEPGMTVTMNVPSRDCVGDFLAVTVRTVEEGIRETANPSDAGERFYRFEITLVEGNEYRANWMPFWMPDPAARIGGIPVSALEPIETSSSFIASIGYTRRGVRIGNCGNMKELLIQASGVGTQNVAGVKFVAISSTAAGSIIIDYYWRLDLYAYTESGFVVVDSVNNPWESPEVGQDFEEDEANQLGWPWQDLELAVQTSTYDPDTNTWAADGQVECRHEGTVIASATGLTMPVYPNYSPIAYWKGSPDFDDVYFSRNFDGSSPEYSDDIESGVGNFTGPYGLTQYLRTDGGSSGSNYISALSPGEIDINCGGYYKEFDAVVSSSSASSSASLSVSPSASQSPSSSVSQSVSPSSSVSPSGGNSSSLSPSASSSPSQSPSGSASPSASVSPSVSPSSSRSPSSSNSPSSSVSPSVSPSSSVSPSAGAGFPSVLGVSAGTEGSNTTTHTITLPTHVGGDLLTVIFAVDDNPTISIDGSSTAGWSAEDASAGGSNLVRGALFKKVADDPNTTLVLTTSTSQQSSWLVYRTDGSDFDATAASGGSVNANPPNHTPAGGAQNYLWLVAACTDSGSNTPSAAPTNYDEMRKSLGGASGASVTVAERELNASSENPGTFTNGIISWVTFTIAIAP
jgi:hypothetical protein